jgi:hypothetical protein
MYISTFGVAAILATTADVSVSKSRAHAEKLRDIQDDLANEKVQCTCGGYLKVLGFAISQKQFKAKVKRMVVTAEFASIVLPGAATTISASGEATNALTRSPRKQLASALHRGARDNPKDHSDGYWVFNNGCVVARAIVDELTGHWRRVTYAKNGDWILSHKLQSA